MTVVEWLLESDPAIRWQVMRDLTDEPDDVVAAERARVASERWGTRLLERQTPDGQWGESAYTRYIDTPDGKACHALMLLRDMGCHRAPGTKHRTAAARSGRADRLRAGKGRSSDRGAARARKKHARQRSLLSRLP
jgi:hypothetical protein